jgi:hypothetical protein
MGTVLKNPLTKHQLWQVIIIWDRYCLQTNIVVYNLFLASNTSAHLCGMPGHGQVQSRGRGGAPNILLWLWQLCAPHVPGLQLGHGAQVSERGLDLWRLQVLSHLWRVTDRSEYFIFYSCHSLNHQFWTYDVRCFPDRKFNARPLKRLYCENPNTGCLVTKIIFCPSFK